MLSSTGIERKLTRWNRRTQTAPTLINEQKSYMNNTAQFKLYISHRRRQRPEEHGDKRRRPNELDDACTSPMHEPFSSCLSWEFSSTYMSALACVIREPKWRVFIHTSVQSSRRAFLNNVRDFLSTFMSGPEQTVCDQSRRRREKSRKSYRTHDKHW